MTPHLLRLLIDENLTPQLEKMAHARGFEAMHVNHLGLRTVKDWDLLKVIDAGSWTLVTNNAFEFRGRYRQIELHPGVVFIVPNAAAMGRSSSSPRRSKTSSPRRPS